MAGWGVSGPQTGSRTAPSGGFPLELASRAGESGWVGPTPDQGNNQAGPGQA